MQPLQAVRVLRQLGRQKELGLGTSTHGTVRLYLHPEDLDSRQRSHTGSGRAPLLHIIPGVTSVQREMHNTMPELTHWTMTLHDRPSYGKDQAQMPDRVYDSHFEESSGTSRTSGVISSSSSASPSAVSAKAEVLGSSCM